MSEADFIIANMWVIGAFIIRQMEGEFSFIAIGMLGIGIIWAYMGYWSSKRKKEMKKNEMS
jgi:hypothetical protein